jgi:hypothetical protein
MPKGTGASLAAGIAGGVVATVTMDAGMVLAARLAPAMLASDKIGPEMIGRWAAGLARGQWRHQDISAEQPVHGELWLGFAAHYFTGIVLTQVYLAAAGSGARRPGVPGAVAYGVATSVLPLLLMYPSMGYGCCGRRSGDARSLVCTMLAGHLGFGVGIGLWAATRRRG